MRISLVTKYLTLNRRPIPLPIFLPTSGVWFWSLICVCEDDWGVLDNDNSYNVFAAMLGWEAIYSTSYVPICLRERADFFKVKCVCFEEEEKIAFQVFWWLLISDTCFEVLKIKVLVIYNF